jgi:hypothetical protein
MVLGGPIFWPLEDAQRVLRFVRDYAPEAPDELGITMAMMPAPPAPFLPPSQFGVPLIGLLLAWAGDFDDGEKAVAPLRQLGSPVADVVRPVPYLGLQSMLDASAPHGRHYYNKSNRFVRLPDEIIDLFIERVESITSPFSRIAGWAMGGAVGRVDPDATAVGDRDVEFDLDIAAAWPPSDPDAERHIAWVRQGGEGMSPHSSGVYANFLSDEGAAGVEAAYGQRLKRLTALKDRYDPTNFFRLNANIPPSRT